MTEPIISVENLYDMLFKRKSFRAYDDALTLTEEDLQDIYERVEALTPLVKNIKVEARIVPRGETSLKRGEYCLLIYSEQKDHHLLNIGYMFEQLDLYLASKNIGVCWCGLGRTRESRFKNLDYVIMMTLGKARESDFREDYKKCSRKETSEIWTGCLASEIGDYAKYAPSACNSQPWRVVCENNTLRVYRDPKARSIIPIWKKPFYGSIDTGIFLCVLELTLSNKAYSFERVLYPEEKGRKLIPVAEYTLSTSF